MNNLESVVSRIESIYNEAVKNKEWNSEAIHIPISDIELIKKNALFTLQDYGNEAVVFSFKDHDDDECIVIYFCEQSEDRKRMHHFERGTFEHCVLTATQTVICDYYGDSPEYKREMINMFEV